MQEAGINGLFSPHSCRSAATSKANASGTTALQQYYSQQVGLELLPSKNFI